MTAPRPFSSCLRRRAARWIAVGVSGVAWALAAVPAAAQPGAAPITIVVPYAQNGPTDRTLRAMVAPLSQALGGTPITVKNVASPGGVNGLAEVAAAKPDGRTLLFTNTNVALLPALGEKLPFDPKDAFSHLGLVLESPMVVLGRPSRTSLWWGVIAGAIAALPFIAWQKLVLEIYRPGG